MSLEIAKSWVDQAKTKEFEMAEWTRRAKKKGGPWDLSLAFRAKLESEILWICALIHLLGGTHMPPRRR